MATLTLRQTSPATGTNKGSPLTNAEVDENFKSLDAAKVEKSGDTMTGRLILAAGTATVAPLQLQTGTSLTTALAGSVEFDGTRLYFTPSSSRKTIAFLDDNITGKSAGWTTPRTLTLDGDVSGSVVIDGTEDETLTVSINANAVQLGADTTGNYVATITGTENQITVTNGSMEGGAVTLQTPQDINTDSDVEFGSLLLGSATFPSTPVAGQLRASDDIVAYSSSDASLKTDVSIIPDALAKVRALRGVMFTWDASQVHLHGHEGRDTGVIAQDVAAVLPEVVTHRDNGVMAVRYEKMMGLLIEAVKELDAKLSACTCQCK